MATNDRAGQHLIDGLFFLGSQPKVTEHPRPKPDSPSRFENSKQTVTKVKERVKEVAPKADNHDLVNRLRALYLDAQREKRKHYERWWRNYRLVNNQAGASGAGWAPAPRDSEIYPTLSALVGWMTDQNTIIDCFPQADPHSPFYSFVSKLAEDMSQLMYTNWLVEDYDAQVKLSLWDTFIYGTGIFKNVWDQSLDGGYGNAVIRRVDPYAFYVDPMATSMDDAEYFVEKRRMSFQEVERRFPNSSLILRASSYEGMEEDEKPTLTGFSTRPNDPPNLGSLPGGGTLWGKNSQRKTSPRDSSTPTIVVYEFWLRENDISDTYEDEMEDDDDDTKDRKLEVSETSCVTKWRVVVVANGEVLMDEYAEDLWNHGQHPYERYVFDDIGEFYGISLVDHLAYPQIYINRLLTALQQNAELTGNPVFIDPTNSGLSRVGITNRPGQRLPVSPAAMNSGQGPHWIDPPQMPPQVLELINFWISRIENTSGLSAIVRGATPTQRNSEGVISSVQEAAFVRIRAGLRNLEKALEKCAVKICDLIAEFYTEPRITSIIGPEGQQTSLVLQARHFYGPTKEGGAPLKFMIQIKAGASAPTSRQARTAEADTMFAMGALDTRSLLEAHQYPHIDTVMKRVKEERAEGVQPPGARQRSGRKS